MDAQARGGSDGVALGLVVVIGGSIDETGIRMREKGRRGVLRTFAEAGEEEEMRAAVQALGDPACRCPRTRSTGVDVARARPRGRISAKHFGLSSNGMVTMRVYHVHGRRLGASSIPARQLIATPLARAATALQARARRTSVDYEAACVMTTLSVKDDSEVERVRRWTGGACPNRARPTFSCTRSRRTSSARTETAEQRLPEARARTGSATFVPASSRTGGRLGPDSPLDADFVPEPCNPLARSAG